MWNKAIGGYPELELPQKRQVWHANALRYQSARAAFSALLQSMPNIRRVWVPVYICNSMLAPIEFSKKDYTFYNIDDFFSIDSPISLGTDDLLLYVNYFGVNDNNVRQILRKFSPNQVVIDCSQAFFANPYDCLATIYSPRKFFGVPDGGLLITQQEISTPIEDDAGSIFRMEHLIKRIAISAEAGYESYRRAEVSLEDCTPKNMSILTQRLLGAIDYSAIREVRRKNFSDLHDALGEFNLIKIDFPQETPLCYPFLPKLEIDKKILVKKNIFIASYWVDVLERAVVNDFERALVNRMIAVPCNQKINNPMDIKILVEELKGFFS